MLFLKLGYIFFCIVFINPLHAPKLNNGKNKKKITSIGYLFPSCIHKIHLIEKCCTQRHRKEQQKKISNNKKKPERSKTIPPLSVRASAEIIEQPFRARSYLKEREVTKLDPLEHLAKFKDVYSTVGMVRKKAREGKRDRER